MVDGKLRHALSLVKDEVRSQHPYKVGVPPGEIAVKLNQNESPFDLPNEVKEAVFRRWQNLSFHRYPSEQPNELVRLIADYTGWEEQGILIGNGSNELTYTLGLVFISSGTRVLLPRPMFSIYERVVNLCGGEVISVPPRENLQFDTEGILNAIYRTSPSIVVVTSPNNPTSLVIPFEEVKSIADAASGIVLVDEAYVEFTDEPSIFSVLDDYPNVLLLRTFSKALGLAGLRIGYLIGAPVLISEILKARPPFMIDHFRTGAVIELLQQPNLVRDRIKRIRRETKNLSFSIQQMEGIRILEVKPILSHSMLAQIVGRYSGRWQKRVFWCAM